MLSATSLLPESGHSRAFAESCARHWSAPMGACSRRKDSTRQPVFSTLRLPAFGFPRSPNTRQRLMCNRRLRSLVSPSTTFRSSTRRPRRTRLGLVLTPLMRPMIAGSVPLAAVDAPQQGTGKTLLVDVASVITTCEAAAVTTAPRSEDEWRKRITTQLLGGQTFILIDNVDGPLQSSTLAAAITARAWRDRILGHNREVIMPVDVTWAVTGNNVRLIGDLVRRSYPVRLDARTSEPWRRSGFRHPDLLNHVGQSRPQLVAAALTLVRAWVQAGRPKPAIPALGSFQAWCDAVGGVLFAAGVEGFLANLETMYEEADPDAAAWMAFLETWYECFGEEAMTANAVVKALEEGDQRFEPLRSSCPTRSRMPARSVAAALWAPRWRSVKSAGTARTRFGWFVLALNAMPCAGWSSVGEPGEPAEVIWHSTASLFA